jgi:hypothetical protein
MNKILSFIPIIGILFALIQIVKFEETSNFYRWFIINGIFQGLSVGLIILNYYNFL